jgi:hypothetical protein
VAAALWLTMSPDLLAVAFLVVLVIGLAAFAIAAGKD